VACIVAAGEPPWCRGAQVTWKSLICTSQRIRTVDLDQGRHLWLSRIIRSASSRESRMPGKTDNLLLRGLVEAEKSLDRTASRRTSGSRRGQDKAHRGNHSTSRSKRTWRSTTTSIFGFALFGRWPCHQHERGRLGRYTQGSAEGHLRHLGQLPAPARI
jgi:hypothetical protein